MFEDYIEIQNKTYHLYNHEAKWANNYYSLKWFTYSINPKVLNITNILTIYFLYRWKHRYLRCVEAELFYSFIPSPLGLHTNSLCSLHVVRHLRDLVISMAIWYSENELPWLESTVHLKYETPLKAKTVWARSHYQTKQRLRQLSHLDIPSVKTWLVNYFTVEPAAQKQLKLMWLKILEAESQMIHSSPVSAEFTGNSKPDSFCSIYTYLFFTTNYSMQYYGLHFT